MLSGSVMASATDFPFFPSAAASNGSANATSAHDCDDDEEDWLSPRRLLSLLTTVLVPLVFGVIVVVGEYNPCTNRGNPSGRVPVLKSL